MHITGNVQTREVFVDGLELSPDESLKITNHSPDGFMWGYWGSGPSQLALAILLSVTDEETAERLYQAFKVEHVATWDKDKDLDEIVNIKDWLKSHGAKGSNTAKVAAVYDTALKTGKKCTPGSDSKCEYAATEPDQCKCDCDGDNHGARRTK